MHSPCTKSDITDVQPRVSSVFLGPCPGQSTLWSRRLTVQSVTMGSLPTSFLLGLGIKGTKEDKRVGREGFGVFPPLPPSLLRGYGLVVTPKKATGPFGVPLHVVASLGSSGTFSSCPFRLGGCEWLSLI